MRTALLVTLFFVFSNTCTAQECSELKDLRHDTLEARKDFEVTVKMLSEHLLRHQTSDLALAYEKCKKVGAELQRENIRLTRGSAKSRTDLVNAIKAIFGKNSEGAAQCFQSLYIATDAGSSKTGNMCIAQGDDKLKNDFGGQGGVNTKSEDYEECSVAFVKFVAAMTFYQDTLKRAQDLRDKCGAPVSAPAPAQDTQVK